MLCPFLQMYIAGNPAWTNLNGLSETHYINHTDVIEKERLSAISSFTNVVRETSSSVCVIVASCHMTHITPCHIYSIVLLLLYTVCWSTSCKTELWGSTGRWEGGSMRVLWTPARPCQISYASGKGCWRQWHSEKILPLGKRWALLEEGSNVVGREER